MLLLTPVLTGGRLQVLCGSRQRSPGLASHTDKTKGDGHPLRSVVLSRMPAMCCTCCIAPETGFSALCVSTWTPVSSKFDHAIGAPIGASRLTQDITTIPAEDVALHWLLLNTTLECSILLQVHQGSCSNSACLTQPSQLHDAFLHVPFPSTMFVVHAC